MSDRRVVITGIGIVSPLAATREATWERLIEGKSGAGRIDAFDPSDMPCKIAFQVPWVSGRGGGAGDPHAFDPEKFVSNKEMRRIDEFIGFSRIAMNVVRAAFALSVLYNIVGIGLAVSGHLSPVYAAVFMPLSSMSVVLFAVGCTYLFAKLKKLI
ncbi:MAG: hypothetical protein LRY55_14155 [Leadbetterella sp.]|nr:hypothetical protein [Leadbetterella sp.]